MDRGGTDTAFPPRLPSPTVRPPERRSRVGRTFGLRAALCRFAPLGVSTLDEGNAVSLPGALHKATRCPREPHAKKEDLGQASRPAQELNQVRRDRLIAQPIELRCACRRHLHFLETPSSVTAAPTAVQFTADRLSVDSRLNPLAVDGQVRTTFAPTSSTPSDGAPTVGRWSEVTVTDVMKVAEVPLL